MGRSAKIYQPTVAGMKVPAGSILWRFSGKEAGEGPWLRVRKTAPTIVPVDELKEPQGSGSSGSFLYRGQRVQFTGKYVNSNGERTTDRSKRALFTRRELLIPTGAPFWIESSKMRSSNAIPAWSAFPLRTSALSAPRLMQRRVINRRQLEKSAAGTRAKDDQGVSWWKVSVGADEDRAAEGWVCEKNHPQTAWRSPWDWPGFEVISESAPPLELFSRELHRIGVATDNSEAENLKIRADGVDGGSLLTALRTAIDAQGDRNGQVSGEELRLSLREPWLADPITRLIVKYESEWSGPMDKWRTLNTLMSEGLPIWNVELERIAKLHLWNDWNNSKTLRLNSFVSHFHSTALTTNFIATCSCGKEITHEELALILPADVKKNGLFYKAHDTTVRNYDSGKFLSLLNRYMRESDIVTCARKAHFLSQMSHECDELRTNEEYRNRDGSVPSGWNDYRGGSNFHGRGLMQLTHDSNYSAYGIFTGNTNIARNPDIVSHNIPDTVNSACWYWRKGSAWGDVNPKADANDFFAITVAVNGGFNHVGERFEALMKLAELLGADRCSLTPNMSFTSYKIEESALAGTRFYRSHQAAAKSAQDRVDDIKRVLNGQR